MAATGYMIPGAPQGNSYAAPIVNFGELGNLPQAWQQGQQYARQRALQTAFPNGLPMDPATGQVDIKAIADTFAKYGDIKEMMPLLQQQMGIQAGQMVNTASNPPGSQPSGPMAPQPAAGPAAMTGQFPQQPEAIKGDTTPADYGQTTLKKMLIARGVDPNSTIGQNFARMVLAREKVGLDNNLSSDQETRLGELFNNNKIGNVDEGVNQTARPASSRDVQSMPPAGSSANDQRTATQPGETAPPFAPQRTAPAEIGSKEGTAPGDSWQAAQTIADRIKNQSRMLTVVGRNMTQQQVEGAKASIANDTEQYKAMVGRLTKAGEIPAEIMKERYKAITASDVKQHEDLVKGIQGLGNSSAGMTDNILHQRSLVNNPNFAAGPWHDAQLFLQRMVPSLAGSPAPTELYKKILSNNMLHMIDGMKAASAEMGSTNGRIFKPMIDMVEQSSGTLDNSREGLQALAEMQYRVLQKNIQIADFATDYKMGHYDRLPAEFKRDVPKQVGQLDDNFVRGMRNWMAKNPILTPEERANPKLLAKASAGPGGPVPQGGKDTGQERDPYEGRTLINPGTGERLHRENGKWISKSPIPGQT